MVDEKWSRLGDCRGGNRLSEGKSVLDRSGAKGLFYTLQESFALTVYPLPIAVFGPYFWSFLSWRRRPRRPGGGRG